MRRVSIRSVTRQAWLSSGRELGGDEIAYRGHLKGEQSPACCVVDRIPGSALQHQTRERLLERIRRRAHLRFEGGLGNALGRDLSRARRFEHAYDLARAQRL